jgi:hypothetical protein
MLQKPVGNGIIGFLDYQGDTRTLCCTENSTIVFAGVRGAVYN